MFELPPYFENISKRLVKSPKLYFTDTGLAAHLAGIRSTEQATRDPIRGGLYENMIIEIMKQRLNHGKKPDLFFYRDTHGNEVDLVILKGRTLIPVEIKSSSTFNDEFHKEIENFNTVAGNKSSPGMVLYNGERSFSFHETNVFNLLLHPEKISSEL